MWGSPGYLYHNHIGHSWTCTGPYAWFWCVASMKKLMHKISLHSFPLLQTIGLPSWCFDHIWPSKSGFLNFLSPQTWHLNPFLPSVGSSEGSSGAPDVEGAGSPEGGSCWAGGRGTTGVGGCMAGPLWVVDFCSCLNCACPALLMVGRFLEIAVWISLTAEHNWSGNFCWSSWAHTCRLAANRLPSSLCTFQCVNCSAVHGMVGVKWSLPLYAKTTG